MDLLSKLTGLMRSLGTAGACANAAAMLERRRREDWLVEGLTHRLDRIDEAVAREAAAA